MKNHTTCWIKHFKQDKRFGHLRFKFLEDNGYGGYPPFDIDESLVDKAKLDDFVKIEKNRIPFFVETSRFGINPWINEIPNFFNGPKIIAVLGRSSFNSKIVGGLSINKVYKDNKKEWFKLARFGNWEGKIIRINFSGSSHR
jgi:hypothetical protein